MKKILKKPSKLVATGFLIFGLSTTGVVMTNFDTVGAEESADTGYDANKISMEGTNQLLANQLPDFSNSEAWLNSQYGKQKLFGQCTWFASGRFYEIYGYQPGFSGDGYMCVGELLSAHNDAFYDSKTAVVGAIGSSDYMHNHVWIVVGVDDDGSGITIQEGNLDGYTNDWTTGCSDWRQKHYTYEELAQSFGNYRFANPYMTPVEFVAQAQEQAQAEAETNQTKEAVNSAVSALTGSKNSSSSTKQNKSNIETSVGAAAIITKSDDDITESPDSIDDVDTSQNNAVQDISNTLIKAMTNKK